MVTSMNGVKISTDSVNSFQTLSQLMNTVQQVVKNNFFNKIWVTAEILKIQKHKSGHIYLQLSDKNEDGVDCTARGVIWSGNSEIVHKFERETRVRLEENLNVMILVEVQFHQKHGLNLNIISIDSSYTIGAFELKLQQIRDHLSQLGEAELNHNLSKPQDFFHVAVIAPGGAAGLSDFRSKADILQLKGLCKFDYFHAQFQGDNRTKSIVLAFQELIQNDVEYDAVCMIRGGGEKAALNELSESVLARAVCRCKYPVFTGIGHKDDSVLLDEYAHTSFATPSMLISHIQNTIVNNARDARRAYVSLQNKSHSLCDYHTKILQQSQYRIQSGIESTLNQWRSRTERLRMHILGLSQKNVGKSRQCVGSNLHLLHKSAQQQINHSRTISQRNQQYVINHTRQLITNSNASVKKSNDMVMSSSRSSLLKTQHELANRLRILLVRSTKLVSQQKQVCRQDMLSVDRNAKAAMRNANQQVSDKVQNLKSNGLMRIRQETRDLNRIDSELLNNARSSHRMYQQQVEQNFKLISAFDPQKTLERGYALIFDDNEKVVKSISELHSAQHYQIKLKDGTVVVENRSERGN